MSCSQYLLEMDYDIAVIAYSKWSLVIAIERLICDEVQ